MLSDDLQARVTLQPRDEEGVPGVDGGEPLQVAVPPVVHVYAVRHDAEVLPRGVDVGHPPVAHDDEAGDVPRQVKLGVQLDGSLGGLVLRPRVHAEAHVDRRAVDRVQGVKELDPGGEALAVPVSVHLLDFFLKSMSRYEVEKL